VIGEDRSLFKLTVREILAIDGNLGAQLRSLSSTALSSDERSKLSVRESSVMVSMFFLPFQLWGCQIPAWNRGQDVDEKERVKERRNKASHSKLPLSSPTFSPSRSASGRGAQLKSAVCEQAHAPV